MGCRAQLLCCLQLTCPGCAVYMCKLGHLLLQDASLAVSGQVQWSLGFVACTEAQQQKSSGEANTAIGTGGLPSRCIARLAAGMSNVVHRAGSCGLRLSSGPLSPQNLHTRAAQRIDYAQLSSISCQLMVQGLGLVMRSRSRFRIKTRTRLHNKEVQVPANNLPWVRECVRGDRVGCVKRAGCRLWCV